MTITKNNFINSFLHTREMQSFKGRDDLNDIFDIVFNESVVVLLSQLVDTMEHYAQPLSEMLIEVNQHQIKNIYFLRHFDKDQSGDGFAALEEQIFLVADTSDCLIFVAHLEVNDKEDAKDIEKMPALSFTFAASNNDTYQFRLPYVIENEKLIWKKGALERTGQSHRLSEVLSNFYSAPSKSIVQLLALLKIIRERGGSVVANEDFHYLTPLQESREKYMLMNVGKTVDELVDYDLQVMNNFSTWALALEEQQQNFALFRDGTQVSTDEISKLIASHKELFIE